VVNPRTRCFLASATLSFHRTAALNLSQSAVSGDIHAAGGRIGGAVLNHAVMRLTATGRVFAEQALLLRQTDEARGAVAVVELQSGKSGRAVLPSLAAPQWLPAACARFNAQHPGIRLDSAPVALSLSPRTLAQRRLLRCDVARRISSAIAYAMLLR
jgi:DNA-binding transcriptional LysR family regulator